MGKLKLRSVLGHLRAWLQKREGDAGGRRLYYLAVMPDLYPKIATSLDEAGMSREPDAEHWQEQIKDMVRAVHYGLLAHRDLARASLASIPLGEGALRFSERMIEILRLGGLPDQVVAYGVDLLPLYAVATAYEHALAAERMTTEEGERYIAELQQYFAALPPEVRARAKDPQRLILTKANSRSTVHRPSYLDYIAIKRVDETGEPVGEYRFLGLYTHEAYHESIARIPVLRRKLAEVLARSGVTPDSHDAKDLTEILEAYPREELFQISADELIPIAFGVLHLRSHPRTRLFLRKDVYGRFMSCVVYLPRDRYTTPVRLRTQEILREALHGETVEYSATVGESPLARLLLGTGHTTIFLIAVLGLWAFTNLELAYALLRVEERLRTYATASLINVGLTIGASLALVVSLGQGARGLLAEQTWPKADPEPGLIQTPRVVYVPPLPYEALPGLAREASVLVMPYADLPVTWAMQPLKLKEYLATGKPAVVRDLPAT